MDLQVRPVEEDERGWMADRIAAAWGSTTIVSRGRVHDASRLPALLCSAGGPPLGLATFKVEGGECELVTLNAFQRERGIGSALLAAAVEEARRLGCRRLWLITTNDNLEALSFYQRRGLRLCAVHAGAVDAARLLKPSIPLVGEHGIPIRDELELEVDLETGQSRAEGDRN